MAVLEPIVSMISLFRGCNIPNSDQRTGGPLIQWSRKLVRVQLFIIQQLSKQIILATSKIHHWLIAIG